ncbi:unnamed protein product [Caenorhabditis auriculariae]|uniref:Uncharacterized protein n=1 Tax=Caenorhabditis auriculariae TaxID=2777116 RepID=A0A8S1HL29_9PELO|nr:unnamed protein product [Caenorhabditis auriculariae]
MNKIKIKTRAGRDKKREECTKEKKKSCTKWKEADGPTNDYLSLNEAGGEGEGGGDEDRERRDSIDRNEQQELMKDKERENPQNSEGEERDEAEGAQNEPFELENGLPESEKSVSSLLSVGDGKQQQGGHEEDVDVEEVVEEVEEKEGASSEVNERPRLENEVQAFENNDPSDGEREEGEGQRGDRNELPQLGQELIEEVEEPEPSQSSDEEGSALTNMVPDEIEPEEVGNEGPVPSQSHDNGSPVSGYEELSNSGKLSKFSPKNPLTRETEPAYIESPE